MSIIRAEEINSKIILSSHIESDEAAKSLYTIEKFFQDNKEAYTLKEEYHLKLGMELLDKYILVTITQIKMYSVENTLQHLLKEKFPNSFIVQRDVEIPVLKKYASTQNTMNMNKNISNNNIKEIQNSQRKKESFFNSMDKKWMAIILLSLVGLMLLYRSAKQLTKIRILQKEVAKYQIILEDEVNQIRVHHG
jgi:hypothetical protein